jgi:superfamily II DNA or RNA helicase
MKIKLFKHQRECLRAIQNNRQLSKRCIVQMFCGSGKTMVMFFEIVTNKYNLNVIVFPSLALMAQFNRDYLLNPEWLEFMNNFKFINICSLTEDLRKLDVQCTTDKPVIVNFLRNKSPKIIAVTYQSYHIFVDIVKDIGIHVNLLQYDEAHHMVGDQAQKIICDDKEYDDLVDQIVFLTATLKNENGVIMYDRNKPETSDCGNLVFEYTHKQGVDDNILNDFEIMIIFHKNQDIDKNNYDDVLEAICRASIETGNGRILTFHSRSETEHDTVSTVTNFATPDNEKKLQSIFKKVLNRDFPKKNAKYANSTINLVGITSNTKNRQDILTKFDNVPKNDLFVLASCQTIGEGVDTKNANMVVFVDPKQSHGAIIQNVGRVTRKNINTRSKATILIPYHVNTDKYINVTNVEEKDKIIRDGLNESGNYSNILNVLCALRQNDPEFYDACLMYPDVFTNWEIETNLKKQGYKLELCDDLWTILEKNNVDLNIMEDIDYDDEEIDFNDQLFDQISEASGRIVEVHTNNIDKSIKYYGIIEEDNEEDNEEPIRIFIGGDDELGTIVKEDDKKHRIIRLNAPIKKKTKLNIHINPDIEIYWSTVNELDINKNIQNAYIEANIVTNKWTNNYDAVKKWYNEHDGQKPSSVSKDNEEKRLGLWCGTQRQNKKKGKLDEDRIKQLEKIVGWEWKLDLDAVWTNNYNEVKKWYNNHNDQKPSITSKDNEEKRLGSWCTNQRTNKKKGKLDEDRIEQLKLIVGWEWELDLDAVWTNNYKEVKRWYDEHDGQKPSEYSKDNEEKRLGSWCSDQRKNKKKDKLDEDRIEQLELIVGWEWELDLDAVWTNNCSEVKKWYNDHNGQKPLAVSKDNEEKRLGSWCTNQRKNKKKGKLDEDRIEQLEKIVGWEWELDLDAVWTNNYDAVKKWYNDHNGQKPSSESKDAEEKRLGLWCGTQRTNKKKGKLDEDRIEQLEKIVGWEWELDLDAVWTNNYNEVKKWYNDHNGQKPSETSKDAEEKRLGKWCGTQRTNKKKGKLDEDRIEQLELIVGWEWELDLDAVWTNNYDAVQKWYNDHNGQKPSITSKDNEEKRLGLWCGHQRTNKKKGKLDEDRIEQLELIVGWEWDQDAVWTNNYDAVKKWYNDHNGQKPLAVSKDNEEKRLGSWCGTQRTNKKNGKLDEDRIEQLELIVGWEWELDLDAVWTNNYDAVKKWYNDHDGQKPSSESKNNEEKRLGSWCTNQRTNKKKDKLDKDKIEQLELIVGWEWELDLDAVWTNNYDAVQKWYNDHNGQKPSSESKNNEEKRLGKWCGTQRTNKKKGKLDEGRIKQLELIIGWEWELDLDAVWTNNYKEVKRWYDEHDGQKPSSESKDNEEKRLGKWCGHQRTNKKKGKLDEGRIDQLELIVGWQWEKDVKLSILTQLKQINHTSDVYNKELEEQAKEFKKIMSMEYRPNKPKQDNGEHNKNYVPRKLSPLSELNKIYKVMHSQTLCNLFKNDVKKWYNYHKQKREHNKAYPEGEIPYQRIIKILEKHRSKHVKHVVDMGCGEAEISNNFTGDNKYIFYNYDHVSCSDNIISCDISNLPLTDHSMDICILSLAMWGSNCHEYVGEAYRVLEDGGLLLIIEPSKRWMGDNNKLKDLLENNKFHVKNVDLGKFMLIEAVK